MKTTNETDLKAILSKNLKILLFKHGESRHELAQKIGVSTPTVSSWLYKVSYPREKALNKLAQHFNIKVTELTTPISEKEELLRYLNNFDPQESIPELAQDLQRLAPSDVLSFDGQPTTQKDMKIVQQALNEYFSKDKDLSTSASEEKSTSKASEQFESAPGTVDLSNPNFAYTWKGKSISKQKFEFIQSFIAGQMNDNKFKPQD